MRFALLIAGCLCGAAASLAWADTSLPMGSAPKALDSPHFPDRMHAFIWRNWTVVEPERIAKVLGTTAENVRAVATSMGLPSRPSIPAEMKTRGYITVLKRNWHLLPYDQLLVLLGMSAEQLAHSLREDDFLIAKLGSLKPACEPLKYAAPDEAARRRAAEIKRIVQETFGDEISQPGEPRFGFIKKLSKAEPARNKGTPASRPSGTGLRYIYSYFAMYGDPLMTPELDPFPDGLLQRLSELGINGVWMHVVLRQLAPSMVFPEFGAGCDVRLANLRKLVERAKRYGIRIYLYMNEPRAMPAAFFEKRPQMKGVQEGEYFAICTSDPQVREWLSDSLAYVFSNVPDLGGVFTITASENLTNCASHCQEAHCPRCKNRTRAAIIAEVNAAIEAGVHRGNPDAKVIAWDWGWQDDWAPEAIALLPKSIWFMSVSEWSIPIHRGGVSTTVGEYSISVVGPGPRATKHWALAKKAGLKTVAKVAVNNSWELSAVPYLPVLDLVAEHCSKLASAGVDGTMLSWTLGGYPSPNLEVAQRFSAKPPPSKEAVLDDIARERFGPEGAPHARKAWTAFSNAFRDYPYDGSVLYDCPIQLGPANLLYATPTGYHATMVGFPYDDIDRWRGPYPAEVFANQFRRVALGWKTGLPELEQAVAKAPAERAADARAELAFAEAAQLQFQSVANQTRFTLARNALADKSKMLNPAVRNQAVAAMKRAAEDEITLARRLFTLTSEDSRIGYEASNHYYYVPADLVETVINCRYVLDHLPAAARP
jgi:hypothetical protein